MTQKEQLIQSIKTLVKQRKELMHETVELPSYKQKIQLISQQYAARRKVVENGSGQTT